MPKYCTAPHCKNGCSNVGSGKKSFYKYPLHDPERLQLWLKNMGREGWTPSCHQYLCHEHFAPSCFILRWGVRYLTHNAVPTIFDQSEYSKKSNRADRFERRAKRTDHFERRARQRQTVLMGPPGPATQAADVPCPDAALQDCQASPVNLYSVIVKSPALPAEDLSGFLSGGDESAGDIPVSLPRRAKLVCGIDAGPEVLVVFERSSPDGADVCADATATMMLDTPLSSLNTDRKDSTTDQKGGEVKVETYFEATPSVPSPLGSMPMPAALPTVCNHSQPSPGSLVLTLEKLVSEGWKETEEDITLAQHSSHLEEHRCHRNRLSTEQLGAISTELQKRVKMLQQRQRRHLDKLLGLESMAAQLRQSNLLLEERLQLLEKAYLRTSAAVSDTGETVAIIYEDNSASYLWTLTETDEERID